VFPFPIKIFWIFLNFPLQCFSKFTFPPPSFLFCTISAFLRYFVCFFFKPLLPPRTRFLGDLASSTPAIAVHSGLPLPSPNLSNFVQFFARRRNPLPFANRGQSHVCCCKDFPQQSSFPPALPPPRFCVTQIGISLSSRLPPPWYFPPPLLSTVFTWCLSGLLAGTAFLVTHPLNPSHC